MKIRALDSLDDWTFGKGLQNYARGLDALKIDLKTRILSWRGDCFYAPGEGVDYVNLLDVGTKALLDQDIRRIILQTPGVVSIDEYDSVLNRETRELEIETKIRTIYGVIRLADLFAGDVQFNVRSQIFDLATADGDELTTDTGDILTVEVAI